MPVVYKDFSSRSVIKIKSYHIAYERLLFAVNVSQMLVQLGLSPNLQRTVSALERLQSLLVDDALV